MFSVTVGNLKHTFNISIDIKDYFTPKAFTLYASDFLSAHAEYLYQNGLYY